MLVPPISQDAVNQTVGWAGSAGLPLDTGNAISTGSAGSPSVAPVGSILVPASPDVHVTLTSSRLMAAIGSNRVMMILHLGSAGLTAQRGGAGEVRQRDGAACACQRNGPGSAVHRGGAA